MQSVLRLIYPPQCVSCGAMVDQEFFLCGDCWKDTAFINGLVCDLCGTPLPGECGGSAEFCDDCLALARPWRRGRAALLYCGNGRRLVLALKHGDRLDLAQPAARWMAASAAAIAVPDMLVVPVPAYWLRLLQRRYNQAALLAGGVASHLRLRSVPDALIRTRRTAVHDGMGRDERFANMTGAIAPHPKRGGSLKGRAILLIDDVMTSGATFAAATETCHAAGADQVFVLALARVAKDA